MKTMKLSASAFRAPWRWRPPRKAFAPKFFHFEQGDLGENTDKGSEEGVEEGIETRGGKTLRIF